MKVRLVIPVLSLAIGVLAGCRRESEDRPGPSATPPPTPQETVSTPATTPQDKAGRTETPATPEPTPLTSETEAATEDTAPAEPASAVTETQTTATTATAVQSPAPDRIATVAEVTSGAAQLRSRLTQLSAATGGRLSPADASRLRTEVLDLAESIRNVPALDKDLSYEAWDRATQAGLTMNELERTASPEEAARLTEVAGQHLQEVERLLQGAEGVAAP